MTTTMLSTAKTNIDFTSLVTRSSTERLTVKHLAREFNMKAVDLKKSLVNHFGSRIQFKRGRTGGIVFSV